MRTAAAALAFVLLSGCAPAATAPATPSPELVASKAAAGLPDCPTSEGASVPGGLPDVTLPCLGGGREVRLSGLRGPLVVNLWAQWCAPCRVESPFLRAFWQHAKGKVAMLGIDYDDPDPARAVEFAGLVGWTYPHASDRTRTLAGALSLPGIPVTLLVDAQGRIVKRFEGPLASEAELTAAVGTYLGVAV